MYVYFMLYHKSLKSILNKTLLISAGVRQRKRFFRVNLYLLTLTGNISVPYILLYSDFRLFRAATFVTKKFENQVDHFSFLSTVYSYSDSRGWNTQNAVLVFSLSLASKFLRYNNDKSI